MPFLRFHQGGQRSVAWLVQAQIRCDHRGQLDEDRLQAAIGFTRDAQPGRFDELNFRGERRLRPVEQACQHLTSLIAIVIHGLFAHQHHVRILAPHNGREDLRHTPGIQGSVEINPDGTIRSHR